MFTPQTIPPQAEESPGDARVAKLNRFGLYESPWSNGHTLKCYPGSEIPFLLLTNNSFVLNIFKYAKQHISAARAYARIDRWCLLNHRDVIRNLPISGALTEAFILLTRMREGHACIIQVGAHTGHGSHDIPGILKMDNVRSFLIEPQPDIFTELERRFSDFPNVTTVNAAISASEDKLHIFRIRESCDIYHARGGKFGRSIGSLDKEHPLQYFRRNCKNAGLALSEDEIIESVPVQSMTAARLIDEYAIRETHALLIDTEGYDYLVLNQFLDTGLMPHLIRYEHVHLGTNKAKSWEKLRDLGYCLAVSSRTGETIALSRAYFN